MEKQANKKFQLETKYHRTYSVEFKKSKVKDLIEKRVTIKMLQSLYGLSRTSIYKWLYLYSPGTVRVVKTVVQMESEEQKTKVLLIRLAEYERIIGQKQMQIDLLEKAFEIASQELGYDIKKKYERTPLSGSADTQTNTHTV